MHAEIAGGAQARLDAAISWLNLSMCNLILESARAGLPVSRQLAMHCLLVMEEEMKGSEERHVKHTNKCDSPMEPEGSHNAIGIDVLGSDFIHTHAVEGSISKHIHLLTLDTGPLRADDAFSGLQQVSLGLGGQGT